MGYVVLTADAVTGGKVFLCYTTSQPWVGPLPLGVFRVDREAALGMGQSRPFTIDLRRMATVPVTEAWFPDLGRPDHGIVGRASERIRLLYEAEMLELAHRYPRNMEHLGPDRQR